MIDLLTNNHRTCDGVSRRDFLQIGALGLFGVTLPAMLRAEAQPSSSRPRVLASSRPRARSVVVIFLGGGISHIDSFDPKPTAPEEIRGPFRAIPTDVPGVQICEHLPEMAKRMKRVTLIRSAAHENTHHETASDWALSGIRTAVVNEYPAMGAVVAHQMGPRGALPPYVVVPQNPTFAGTELGRSAFLGSAFESFATGDPSLADFQVRDIAPPATVTATRLTRRRQLREALDVLTRDVERGDAAASHGSVAAMDRFQKRATELVLSPEARSAFDLKSEKEALRERYGRNLFGQSALLTRRLVERGVRFVTINYRGWDHHEGIFGQLTTKLPEFDRGLTAFLDDMGQRGLLRDTLVAVLGEFGRTPRVNNLAGRDHWSDAGCQIWFGAGVPGGQVIGATNDRGEFATDRPISHNDTAATIYDAIGLDYHRELHTPNGRPVPILATGTPIRELGAG